MNARQLIKKNCRVSFGNKTNKNVHCDNTTGRHVSPKNAKSDVICSQFLNCHNIAHSLSKQSLLWAFHAKCNLSVYFEPWVLLENVWWMISEAAMRFMLNFIKRRCDGLRWVTRQQFVFLASFQQRAREASENVKIIWLIFSMLISLFKHKTNIFFFRWHSFNILCHRICTQRGEKYF